VSENTELKKFQWGDLMAHWLNPISEMLKNKTEIALNVRGKKYRINIRNLAS